MSSHTIDDSIQLTDIDALNDLTDQLRDDEPDRAYAASQEAHRLATAATPLYQPGIARSLHQMGALRWRQGDRAAATESAARSPGADRNYRECGA